MKNKRNLLKQQKKNVYHVLVIGSPKSGKSTFLRNLLFKGEEIDGVPLYELRSIVLPTNQDGQYIVFEEAS